MAIHCVSRKGWNIGWVLLFPYSSSVPKLVLSFSPFSLPPLDGKTALDPQVALTFLISLPTLSLSIGLLREPPSLATGSAIILNTWVGRPREDRVPPLGIPSPSPT